jgi:hypothetical protein
MDIHLLRLAEHTAMKYAAGHAKGNDFQSFLDSIEQWAGNLQEQGYTRVVSLVISFQWSSGVPWERVEESPPPRRAAGAEIEAAFLAERMVRHVDCDRVLKESRMCRAGSIALLDARVLGADLQAKTKATLMGQALTIEHWLNPLEREVLDRMGGRVAVADLVGMFSDVDAPAVIAAARSLLGRRLVGIEAPLYRPMCSTS